MNSQILDSIRQAVDIVQIIGETVPLKKSGTNYLGLCPFHNEKSPSFSVSSTKQLFHCFGCKVGGDVFQFVKLYHRWDFTQALEELAKRAHIKLESQKIDPDWEVGLHLLEVASLAFEEVLHSGKNPQREYLQGRKIPAKLWKDFRLGAHPGGFDFLVSRFEKKGLDCDLGVRLGLLGRNSSGNFIDRFQGRLMFPIPDEKGRIRGFGGRTLKNENPKYINSPKTRHFDKSRLLYGMHLACTSIPKKGYIVLVEGYLDVISLHEFGISNAVGSMGTALTSDQIRTMKRYSSRVISLYDRDQAGLAATEKNLGAFFKEGLEAKVVRLPEGKDPDAFLHQSIQSIEKGHERLKEAFENSTSAIDYLIESTVLAEKDALVRGKRIRNLVDILNHVPDELERTFLKKDLAKRFELPENLLFPRAVLEERPKSQILKESSGFNREADGRWEREILKFLVQFGEVKDFALTEVASYLSSSSRWSQALLRLTDHQVSSRAISDLKNIEDLDGEVQSAMRGWSFEPKRPEMEIEQLWSDLMRGLKRAYFQRESFRLQSEIAKAEQEGDSALSRKLLTEKQDLIRIRNAMSSDPKGVDYESPSQENPA